MGREAVGQGTCRQAVQWAERPLVPRCRELGLRSSGRRRGPYFPAIVCDPSSFLPDGKSVRAVRAPGFRTLDGRRSTNSW